MFVCMLGFFWSKIVLFFKLTWTGLLKLSLVVKDGLKTVEGFLKNYMQSLCFSLLIDQ